VRLGGVQVPQHTLHTTLLLLPHPTPSPSAGASLKFTVLNPKGRVWLMVAGGGASVIYAGGGALVFMVP
jgi:hypothetical protein